LIATEHRLPDVDRSTFTVAGRALRDPAWVTQWAGFQVYRLGGFELVQLANSLLLSATIALLVWLCWRRSRSLLIAGAVGVFTVFGIADLLLIRPQTVSLLLFVMLYLVLDTTQRRPWLLALPPMILCLWSNAHPAFLAGLLLIGAFLLAAVVSGDRRGSIGLALCL